ncbi:MAG: hypothetical protein JST80_13335 [Bdellovibrionales bacterium]|nr:hypothetical protein [Bdellovibrionales bacterium]
MKSVFFILSFVLVVTAANADKWDGNNNPANMGKDYKYDFDNLPLTGSVTDNHMPWSDNYWESDWAGISLRWNTYTAEQLDPDQIAFLDKYSTFSYTPPTKDQVLKMAKEDLKKLSPAEKYDLLMGRYDFPTVKSERARTDPGMKDWQGLCHGWVPASINYSEPLPIEAANADGVVVPFGSSDIKGLLSYYYGVPAYDYARGNRILIRKGTQFLGLDIVDAFDPRNWVPIPADTNVWHNGYGTPVASMPDSAQCDDSGFAARFGGTKDKCIDTFVFGAQVDALNLVGQVGIRPTKDEDALFGGTKGIKDPNAGAFHVVMANQLGLMNRAFAGNINKKIKNAEVWNQPIVGYATQVLSDRRNRRGGKVEVETTLRYVTEIPQTWDPVVGTPKQRFDQYTFRYTVELDTDGNIVGGEWNDRKKHPSFIWKHDKLVIKGYMSKLNEIYHPRFQ